MTFVDPQKKNCETIGFGFVGDTPLAIKSIWFSRSDKNQFHTCEGVALFFRILGFCRLLLVCACYTDHNVMTVNAIFLDMPNRLEINAKSTYALLLLHMCVAASGKGKG